MPVAIKRDFLERPPAYGSAEHVIQTRIRRFRREDHKFIFEVMVTNPPVLDQEGAWVRNLTNPHAEAFWAGFDDKPYPFATMTFSVAHQAGKLRRGLEKAGKLPKVNATKP